MGWRERAEQVLGSGDTRDTSAISPHDLPENGPTVPSVLGPQTSLKLWRSALADIDPREPYPGYDANRWYNLVDTSVWWFEAFGRQAALDGWQPGCVFGVADDEFAGVPIVEEADAQRVQPTAASLHSPNQARAAGRVETVAR